MHDEPTTMGGDHDWEKKQRDRIDLLNNSPLTPPPKEWRDRWVGPFIIIGVIIIWYWIIKGLITLWGWWRG